jgi:hypothetical protein
MGYLESLTKAVAAQPDLQRSLSLLVNALADRIKATSNDQNIQNLARELKVVAPTLVEAIAEKAVAPTAR